jgi:hypothetical protein
MRAKILSMGFVLVLVMVASLPAWAGTYSFTLIPTLAGTSRGLDTSAAYTYGISQSFSGQTIVSASLSFVNIRNSITSANDLYVHLLDNPTIGLTTLYDSASGDYFSGQGLALGSQPMFHNLGTTGINRTYNFTASDISSLISYVSNSIFGFGFDPDCKYYFDSSTFTVNTTTNVPEPGIILLLGIGVGVVSLATRRFKA